MEDAAVCLFCVCAGAFGGSALNTLAEYQLLCHTVLCCAVLCVQVYRGKWCSIDIAAKEYLAVDAAAVCLFCVWACAFGGSALNTLAEYLLLCRAVLCCGRRCTVASGAASTLPLRSILQWRMGRQTSQQAASQQRRGGRRHRCVCGLCVLRVCKQVGCGCVCCACVFVSQGEVLLCACLLDTMCTGRYTRLPCWQNGNVAGTPTVEFVHCKPLAVHRVMHCICGYGMLLRRARPTSEEQHSSKCCTFLWTLLHLCIRQQQQQLLLLCCCCRMRC